MSSSPLSTTQAAAGSQEPAVQASVPATSRRAAARRRRAGLLSAAEIAPLTAILTAFLVLPIGMILVVSFWKFLGFVSVPAFIVDNYVNVLTSPTTLALYWNTLRLLLITWAITLLLGFTLAYHLVFDVRLPATRTIKFMLLAIPFWTSTIIRTIAWVPFLGRHGLVNDFLVGIGLVNAPLNFLLFSEFAVILSYAHMFTGLMMAPIFNTMSRIERSLIEAAVDAGAAPWQVLRRIIIPLTMPGIAIGTIFVLTMVVGDVATVRLLGGNQIGTIAMAMYNQISMVQFPLVCANAMILLTVVLVAVALIVRVVDIRREI
jgi:putative spermidine/putrescine transport system permease protein